VGINLEDALGEKVLENGGFLPVVMEDVLMVYITSRVLPFPPQDSSIFISVLKPQKKYLSTLRAVFN
jgi:hypothetical protein